MSNANKKTFPCFACEKRGFKDVQVILGGKDEYGKTIYIEPDGITPHHHKGTSPSSTTQQQQRGTPPTLGLRDVVQPAATQEVTTLNLRAVKFDHIVEQIEAINHKLDQLLMKRNAEAEATEAELAYDRDREDGYSL